MKSSFLIAQAQISFYVERQKHPCPRAQDCTASVSVNSIQLIRIYILSCEDEIAKPFFDEIKTQEKKLLKKKGFNLKKIVFLRSA